MITNQKYIDLKKLMKGNPYSSLKDPSTPRSWKAVLLCVAPMLIFGRIIGAIIFGFLIMNLATEKSTTESPKSLIEETK